METGGRTCFFSRQSLKTLAGGGEVGTSDEEKQRLNTTTGADRGALVSLKFTGTIVAVFFYRNDREGYGRFGDRCGGRGGRGRT